MTAGILRVLLADDERMARQRLRRLLSAMKDVEIVAECSDGDQVLQQLDRVAIDVAVLDIQMPGLSGLGLAEVAADWGVEVIFATAHPEHALAAFEQGVVDYVVKPIEPRRLAIAIERTRQRVLRREVQPAPGAVSRIAFAVRDEVCLVDPAEITHAVLEDELLSVWVDGRALLADLSLSELHRKLPQHFVRVHRRALLNLEKVERLKPQPSGGYRAVLSDGHEVPVSRQAARELRKQFAIR